MPAPAVIDQGKRDDLPLNASNEDKVILNAKWAFLVDRSGQARQCPPGRGREPEWALAGPPRLHTRAFNIVAGSDHRAKSRLVMTADLPDDARSLLNKREAAALRLTQIGKLFYRHPGWLIRINNGWLGKRGSHRLLPDQ